VLSAGGDAEVHIHSIPDGEKRVLTGHTSGIKDIEICPDHQLVASAGIDGVVRVWRLDGTLLHTLRGHRSQVKGVVLTQTHVVSGAEDHELRVWPLAQPSPAPRGRELREWLRQQTNVEVGDEADPAPPE
jgi:WD40 repeat protein